MTTTDDSIAERRALEALRSGVPNRDAVRVLGCDQPQVQSAFESALERVGDSLVDNHPVPGLLVSGDFGTGKSHVLEYLEYLALERNFVCSRVVISKETPLYDLGKVFKAAVDTAEAPGLAGPAVAEIALNMKTSSPRYVDFYRWTHTPESGLSEIFPATLFLYERLNSDPELAENITNFWSGERLSVADVRAGLKQLDAAKHYSVKAPKITQLARERFLFLSRLITGAGFAGWVVLIDEVELVGRYSILQRGKSYATLARLLGHIEDDGFPGAAVVATITDDFGIKVLDEKGDYEAIVPRLQGKGTDEWMLTAAHAETGMRLIDRSRTALAPPDEASLRSTYERLREIHASAYQWRPPDIWTEHDPTRRMRSHVRRWIATWDLERLYPGSQLEIQEEDIAVTYGEDSALEDSDAEDRVDA